MSKDEERGLFWDPNASARRLQEAPNRDDLAVTDSADDGQNKEGESPEEPPVSGAAVPDLVDLCLQRAVEAGTTAYESDSPEAWREVVSAVAVLADMAQTREVVAEIKQSARQMAQAAEIAQRLAQEAVDVAAKAMQKAEQLEAVVARASEANSGEAWREAHQLVLALSAAERTPSRSSDPRRLAPSRSLPQRPELNEDAPASRAQ